MSKNQYKNEIGDGVLFKNVRKAKPSQPDYTGTVELPDGAHWLSAWLNKSKKGMTYMSLRAGPLVGEKMTRGIPNQGSFDDEPPF